MDVCAKNRGRRHQKKGFPCGTGDGEKVFDPWASGHKGQECPQEIRTRKFMFMLFLSSLIVIQTTFQKEMFLDRGVMNIWISQPCSLLEAQQRYCS